MQLSIESPSVLNSTRRMGEQFSIRYSLSGCFDDGVEEGRESTISYRCLSGLRNIIFIVIKPFSEPSCLCPLWFIIG